MVGASSLNHINHISLMEIQKEDGTHLYKQLKNEKNIFIAYI